MKRFILYAVLFAANFLISAYITMILFLKSEGYVEVPDLKGKSPHEASRLLRELNLNLVTTKSERSDEIPKGLIVRQKPEPHSVVKKGRRIYVTVSSGPEMVIVPDVRDLSLGVAEKILSERGLQVKEVIYVPSREERKVLAQIPRENDSTLKGKGLSLIVGRREDHFYVMPDIEGVELKEVLDELEEKGLTYRVNHVREPLEGKRPKIYSNIKPGSILGQQDVIEIVVNLGG